MKAAVRMFAPILGLLLAAVPCIAAPVDRGPSRGDLERVRKKVENLRVWQLTEELNLSGDQASRLFPLIREMDKDRLTIEAQNRELMQEMNRELHGEKTDQDKIARTLDRLLENRERLTEAEVAHVRKVRDILSAEDTARYVLFSLRFQREIRERIAALGRERGEGGLGRDLDDVPGRGPGGKGR